MLALPLCALLSAAAPSLRIAASVDGQPASPAWAYARAGQRVVLRADLTPDVPGAKVTWLQL
ncbi:MAG TPA: hypothetical protein VND93_03850, partial [Myxococcales bacterium]|nr:hypothetical protein [Myxococcales bacterium]